jgi:hypothetical protein
MEKHGSPHRNPFLDSAVPSTRASSDRSRPSEIPSGGARTPAKRRFRTYRLKGEYEKPWLNDKRLKKTRCGNYIIWGFIVVALMVSGYINYNSTTQVSRYDVGGSSETAIACLPGWPSIASFWTRPSARLILLYGTMKSRSVSSLPISNDAIRFLY